MSSGFRLFFFPPLICRVDATSTPTGQALMLDVAPDRGVVVSLVEVSAGRRIFPGGYRYWWLVVVVVAGVAVGH